MALIDKDDLKTELGISESDTTYDTLLTLMASMVQSLFDTLTGRTIESGERTEYYNSDSYNDTVLLKNWPVTSKDSVTLYDDPDWEWGSDSQIAAADFTVDLVEGIIYYDGYFYEGKQSIKVVYTAGYTTVTFPAGWKEIWTRQASHWFYEAKNKQWHLQMISPPGGGGGGSLMTKSLQDNLLPDFALLVARETR